MGVWDNDRRMNMTFAETGDYDEFAAEREGCSQDEIEAAWQRYLCSELNPDQAGCESGPDEWEA